MPVDDPVSLTKAITATLDEEPNHPVLKKELWINLQNY